MQEASAGVRDASDQVAPSKEWLWSRVACLTHAARKSCLDSADIQDMGGSSSSEHAIKHSEWGFSSLPSLDELFKASQEGRGSLFLDSLHSSRTFHSPDCTNAMAEAYSISHLLEGLKGSTASAARSATSEAAVDDLRSMLKADIKSAWSEEAVRRGVTAAKSGDYETAHSCYGRALELDRRNADAWVARGAAYANQKMYQKAASDFETALELRPDHVNAKSYLAATKQRMAQLGLHRLLPDSLLSPGPVAANPSSADATPGHPQLTPEAAKHTMLSAAKPAATHAADRQTGALHHSAKEQSSAEDGISSSSERTDDEDTGNMDLNKALKIVTKHYSRRNAQDQNKEKGDAHSKRKRRRQKDKKGRKARKKHKHK